MTTKDYRKEQFKRICTNYSAYLPKIRISDEYGQTNHLDITLEELEQIKTILTK